MTRNTANKPLDLPSFFPYQLSILESQVSNKVAHYYVSTHGMSRNEWRVMASLAMHEEVSAKDIALFIRLEKMQVSRAVTRLKAAGLVLQKASSTDRRASSLKLTSKGSALYREIIPYVLASEKQILEGLSKEECAQLRQLTEKLYGHINTMPENND